MSMAWGPGSTSTMDGLLSSHMQRDSNDDLSMNPSESPLCQSDMDCDSNMSLWLILVLILFHGTITISTLFGNVLVILSVFTYKPLRIVQNFFIVSLAVADLAVGLLVMPFNIAYFVLGKWIFGIHVCKLWLTCDVLCCTASILNLCTIALDRYWAINDPINYAQKRTLDRVLIIIAGTWVISMAISSPPLLGWNDWPERLEPGTPCQLTRRKGYVIYSAIGSFWAPLAVMSIVYLEIFSALRKRAKAKKSRFGGVMASGMRHRDNEDIEDSGSSETNHNERSTHKTATGHTSLIDDDRTEVNVGTTPPKASGSSSGGSGIHSTQQQQQQNAGGGGGHTRRGGPGKQVDTNATVYQFRIEERQRISLSKESRAVRTLTIIWITFVVCWVPFFLMYIIGAFCEDCFSGTTIHMLTWLGYINSALNPLIYTIFNEDYRKAFRKLLCILPDPDDAAARARSSRNQHRAAPSLQPLSSAE